MSPQRNAWGVVAFGYRWVERDEGLGMLASILLLLAGMTVSWVAVLCGIKAPIEWPVWEG